MADTGLLVSQAFADRETTPDDVYRDILFDRLSLNEGMLVENAVAQQFRANGRKLYFFSRSDRTDASKTMEIDFLIVRENDNAAMKPRISPIEYVLHPRQLEVNGERIKLPLYMAHCL